VIWGVLLTILKVLNYLPNDSGPTNEWRIFGYVGFVVIFALTFFLNTSYIKYRLTLRTLNTLDGNVKEISALARVIFQEERAIYAETIVRLINLTYHVYFYEAAKLPLNLYKVILTEKGLIEGEEYEKLNAYPLGREFLCFTWTFEAMETFYRELVKEESAASVLIFSESYQRMIKGALNVRGNMYIRHSIPFAYYHFLCVSIYIYLLGCGFFACVKIPQPFNPCYLLLYLVVCIGFLGLFRIGLQLGDPFGMDDIDINIPKLMNRTFEGTQQIFHRDYRNMDHSANSAIVSTKKKDTSGSAFLSASHALVARKKKALEEKKRSSHTLLRKKQEEEERADGQYKRPGKTKTRVQRTVQNEVIKATGEFAQNVTSRWPAFL